MPERPENSINSLLGSGGISQLLQNPEIAAKLPRIMEALAPVMAEMKAEKAAGASPAVTAAAPTQSAPSASAAEASAPADGIAAAAAALADGAAPAALPASVGKASSASRRMALLRALSPYLSEERQSALDTVMKVSTLLELLGEVL